MVLTRICFVAQSNRLLAMISPKLQKALRGMPTVFPWGMLEIHWKRLKRLFGYVVKGVLKIDQLGGVKLDHLSVFGMIGN